MDQKNVWVKKIGGKNDCGVKQKFGKKKFLGQTKFWVKKKFWVKNFVAHIIFGLKIFG